MSNITITVSVGSRGHVTVERIVNGKVVKVTGMSPFSERAKRLAAHYGEGDHSINDFAAAQDTSAEVWNDLMEALS